MNNRHCFKSCLAARHTAKCTGLALVAPHKLQSRVPAELERALPDRLRTLCKRLRDKMAPRLLETAAVNRFASCVPTIQRSAILDLRLGSQTVRSRIPKQRDNDI
jgi:hypothetical protein